MPASMTKNFSKPSIDEEKRVVADGVYRVKLMNIGEPKMSPGFNNGPEQEQSIFRFEITRDLNLDDEGGEDQVDHTGRELSMWVNVNATGELSWMYKITEAITGQSPKELGDFDMYQLVYQECKVTVKRKPSQDGTKINSKITDLMPIRSAKKAVNAVAEAGQPAGYAPAKPAPTQAKKKLELDDIEFE